MGGEEDLRNTETRGTFSDGVDEVLMGVTAADVVVGGFGSSSSLQPSQQRRNELPINKGGEEGFCYCS